MSLSIDSAPKPAAPACCGTQAGATPASSNSPSASSPSAAQQRYLADGFDAPKPAAAKSQNPLDQANDALVKWLNNANNWLVNTLNQAAGGGASGGGGGGGGGSAGFY